MNYFMIRLTKISTTIIADAGCTLWTIVVPCTAVINICIERSQELA